MKIKINIARNEKEERISIYPVSTKKVTWIMNEWDFRLCLSGTQIHGFNMKTQKTFGVNTEDLDEITDRVKGAIV